MTPGSIEQEFSIWSILCCFWPKGRIETDDPERLPLSSQELLGLQWVLQRVAVLAGAGEMEEEVQSGDDSDSGCIAAYDIHGQGIQRDGTIEEDIESRLKRMGYMVYAGLWG